MPTLIDELIVRLDLDPANFEKGQKKQAEAWLKTRDGFRKGGKEIEESSKKAAETVNLITRRVLELFAVGLPAAASTLRSRPFVAILTSSNGT
ncbi:hypothetical protein ACWGS9_19875 [Bradyrhizobium sp. Arg314]